jgi:hypothetical protein
MSLNSIKKLALMAKSCVFFEVWTEFLNIIKTIFGFKGLRYIYSMIFNDTYRIIRPVISFRARDIDKEMHTIVEFPHSNWPTASIVYIQTTQRK